MGSISRLVRRKENGIYYCRAAVPKDLIKFIGKREIKISLGTSDYKLAKTLVLIESAKINQQFAQLRGETTINLPSALTQPLYLKGQMTLGDLIEKYKASPERNNITPASKADYEAVYHAIKELIGEATPLHRIERELCRHYQQVVMQMPAHSTKRFPNIPLLKAIELNKQAHFPKMSVHNVNKYVSRFAGLLQWACDEGLLASNPARGLQIQDTVKLKDKRDPFSTEQLRQIFSTSEMKDYQAAQHPRYWIPTLAMWTGARLNEICQLHVADIQEQDGILCVSINEHGEKRIKTDSAKRLIPVHPHLLELGFQCFVEEQRKQGYQRLFPELKNGSRNKPADLFSKWFTRYLRDAKVKTDKTCFHSFRHNFRDALREAGVERGIARALGGWSDKDSGVEDNYGSGYSVQRLFEAITQIEYRITY